MANIANQAKQIERDYTLGFLLRGKFRRFLMKSGLIYKEDKGLLNSLFVVSGSEPEMDRFHRAIVQWKLSMD